MTDWERSSRRREAVSSIKKLEQICDECGTSASSILNTRAVLALYGEYSDPGKSLIELLLSGAPLSTEVRELLAEALAGINEDYPRLMFVGNVGPKSEPGLIQQRRRWLAIADDFNASGLSEPEYLKANRMLDERQRKLLQSAKAFHRSMKDWIATSPAHYVQCAETTDSEADIRLLQRKCFCEFVVDNNLLDQKSLSEFLRGG